MKKIIFTILIGFLTFNVFSQDVHHRIKLVGDKDSRWCVYGVTLKEDGEWGFIEEDEGVVLIGRVVWYNIHVAGEYLFVEFKQHDPNGTQRLIGVDTYAPRKRTKRIKVKSGYTMYTDGKIERFEK